MIGKTVRKELEMNHYWARENPALAIKSTFEFMEECRDAQRFRIDQSREHYTTIVAVFEESSDER